MIFPSKSIDIPFIVYPRDVTQVLAIPLGRPCGALAVRFGQFLTPKKLPYCRLNDQFMSIYINLYQL